MIECKILEVRGSKIEFSVPHLSAEFFSYLSGSSKVLSNCFFQASKQTGKYVKHLGLSGMTRL